MNISHIPQRLEIAFWVTIIAWMKGSSYLRFALRETFLAYEKARHFSWLLYILAWATTGLTLGFVFGLMVSSIR